jgi:hypothetical protein
MLLLERTETTLHYFPHFSHLPRNTSHYCYSITSKCLFLPRTTSNASWKISMKGTESVLIASTLEGGRATSHRRQALAGLSKILVPCFFTCPSSSDDNLLLAPFQAVHRERTELSQLHCQQLGSYCHPPRKVHPWYHVNECRYNY